MTAPIGMPIFAPVEIPLELCEEDVALRMGTICWGAFSTQRFWATEKLLRS